MRINLVRIPHRQGHSIHRVVRPGHRHFWRKLPYPRTHSSRPKREGSQVARQLGSNNRVESWFVRPPFLPRCHSRVRCPCATMQLAWAEDRALLGSNPSAVPGANTEWGGTMPPSSIRDWHPSAKSSPPVLSLTSILYAATRARHSAYVIFLLSMYQMIVASLRITATRAMVDPRRRLMRLNHSRSRASLRSTLYTNCASNHRAVELPALVMLPSR